jgi:hypothetical protein
MELVTVEHMGHYLMKDGYIALRDFESNEWRVSKLSWLHPGTTTMSLVATLTHLYEVHGYIDSAVIKDGV